MSSRGFKLIKLDLGILFFYFYIFAVRLKWVNNITFYNFFEETIYTVFFLVLFFFHSHLIQVETWFQVFAFIKTLLQPFGGVSSKVISSKKVRTYLFFSPPIVCVSFSCSFLLLYHHFLKVYLHFIVLFSCGISNIMNYIDLLNNESNKVTCSVQHAPFVEGSLQRSNVCWMLLFETRLNDGKWWSGAWGGLCGNTIQQHLMVQRQRMEEVTSFEIGKGKFCFEISRLVLFLVSKFNAEMGKG